MHNFICMRNFLSCFFFFSLIVQASYAQVLPEELSRAVKERIKLVPEFAFIQKQANELGVKVYLFGGTASAFGHYVRWDLEREAGDDKYQKERFDYDFTNIYRGNQDLDIVVDGSIEQINQLQSLLKEAFPHFVGNKEAWEIRSLRDEKGDKEALLDNPSFLNQHTDSNSTGLIDLNAEADELVFRDLFAWNKKDSLFLEDVSQAKIIFLYSEKHHETQRYKDGKNPPLFAAIRYLAKLAQYEVQGRERDLKTIKKIIDKTDWEKVKTNQYVKNKLSEFSKKVLLNAPDSEYAWNLLDNLGLRQKLIEMDGNQEGVVESLSWWMNKEPLRSKPLGTQGKKAKEIFGEAEIILTHETNSFLAYENITRSSKGLANAFISREGIAGEAAAFGDGFYTKIGDTGARGTGLSIRFVLHPEAREGRDFIRGNSLDFVIVRNKNALTLIQENINLSLIDYLKLLSSGEIGPKDKGLLEKFNRKFRRLSVDSKEFKEAERFVRESTFIAKDLPKDWGTQSVFEISNFDQLIGSYIGGRTAHFKLIVQELSKVEKFTKKHLKWLKRIIEVGTVDHEIVESILKYDYWLKHPEIVEMLIEKDKVDDILIIQLLSQKGWEQYPYLVEKIMKKNQVNHLVVQHILSELHWSHQEAWLTTLAKKSQCDQYIIQYLLSKKEWKHREDVLDQIVDRGKADHLIAELILSKGHWAHRVDILKKILERGEVNYQLIHHVFSTNIWIDYPELLSYFFEETALDLKILIEKVLSKPEWKLSKDQIDELYNKVKGTNLVNPFVRFVLSQEQYIGHSDIVKDLLNSPSGGPTAVSEYILTQKHWAELPQTEVWIEQLISDQAMHRYLVASVFSNELWAHREDLLDKIIESARPDFFDKLIEHIFSKKFWMHKFDFKTFGRSIGNIINIVKYILSQEHYKNHIDLVNQILAVNNKSIDEALIRYVFSEKHWSSHPEFIYKLIDRKTNGNYIAQYILSKEYWFKHTDLVGYLIDKGTVDVHVKLIEHVLFRGYWQDYPIFIEKLIRKIRINTTNSKIAEALLFSSTEVQFWFKYPELLVKLFEKVHLSYREGIVRQILRKDGGSKHPEIISQLISISMSGDKASFQEFIRVLISHTLSERVWSAYPWLIEQLIDTKLVSPMVVKEILSQSYWLGSVDLVKRAFENEKSIADRQALMEEISSYILSKGPRKGHLELAESFLEVCEKTQQSCHFMQYFLMRSKEWTKYPHLIERLMDNPKAQFVVLMILNYHDNKELTWKNYPHLLIRLINESNIDENRIEIPTFVEGLWGNHPDLISYLNGKSVNVKNIKARSRELSFNDWEKQHKVYSCKRVLSF